MIEQFHEDNIPVDKLITLVRDGPNVNKAIMRKIEQTIKDKHPEFKGFVDLGSCVLHVVHNGFSEGLEMYGKDIDQLCLDLHAIFKYNAARRKDYQQLQANLGADIETFQQHTEVRWLSIGPAIRRVLEQWDTICQFIKDLEKNNTGKPKSINFKRAAALLATGERNVTRVMLEFLRSTVPVFEEFLTVLQTSGPTVHVVYDAMRLTLLKLMRRFVQADQLKDVHGSALQSVSCQAIKDQLPDGELVIGDNIRKYLPLLKPDKQKAALLGMRAFWGAAVSHLQAKLSLNNRVLKDLGCLNPLKRERKSTTISIQNLSRKLLPEFDTAAVLDEWKLYQNDGDISDIDSDQRVDHYWNAVFLLTSVEGNGRYQLLPRLVKSCLVLAQANADSERSLSVNARVVTKERSRLGSRPLSACAS